MELALTALGLFLVFVGFVGLIVPLLPDVPLISGGVLLVLIAQNQLSAAVVIPIIVLTALAMLADWLLVLYGAKKLGATREGTIGGVLGLFLGLATTPLGLFGSVIILPAVGAVIGEYIGRRNDPDHKKATLVGMGVGLFAALSLVIKLVLIGLIVLIGALALGLN